MRVPCDRLLVDDGGSTSIGYGLLAAMMAIVAIVGLTAFATASNDLWAYVTDTVLASIGS